MLLKKLPTKKVTSKAGRFGEDFACNLLLQKGYKIIDRNFRSRFGEIDIIASKEDYLIFIEVKTRWNLNYGYPEEAVNEKKLWKIRKTAEYYLMNHTNATNKIKIEIVSLLIENNTIVRSKIIIVD